VNLTTNAHTAPASAITQSLIRLMLIIAFGSFSAMAARTLAIMSRPGNAWSGVFMTTGIVAPLCVAALATGALYYALKKFAPFVDVYSHAQAKSLDTLNVKYVDSAILFSAALGLFLELSVIRWQSSVLPFFAFYKNFSLLACFVGLGLGYALAARDRIPMVIVLPLLAWQFGFMIIVRYGLEIDLKAIPFREQLTMGMEVGNLSQILLLQAVLAIVFLITALTFVPIGQLCGRLMERRTKLRAYGLNLLGSLLGVLLTLAASLLWTPPLAWFALCFLAILLFTLKTHSLVTVGFFSRWFVRSSWLGR
jgi:hypothetical protein